VVYKGEPKLTRKPNKQPKQQEKSNLYFREVVEDALKHTKSAMYKTAQVTNINPIDNNSELDQTIKSFKVLMLYNYGMKRYC